MTLIDYLNRVHFADNILEEALWAELDQRNVRSVLILADQTHLGDELGERLHDGISQRCHTVEVLAGNTPPEEHEARRIAQLYSQSGCQAIVAFGPGCVIDLAKAVRLLAANDRSLAAYAITEGGGYRIKGKTPDLIAIPTLKGFASGFNGLTSVRLESGQMADIASRDLVPSVTICDPTLVTTEPAEIQASAGVSAITRCIEALLSPNYNPPADGMALDGLNRALRSIHKATRTGELNARREMMAASMNAALVQQKGLGLVHAIGSALDAVTSGALDRGAVARLLLPEILNFYASTAKLENPALIGAFGVNSGGDLASEVKAIFDDLPLPASLRELGIEPDQISRAAPLAARHRVLSNGPFLPKSGDILSILQSVQ